MSSVEPKYVFDECGKCVYIGSNCDIPPPEYLKQLCITKCICMDTLPMNTPELTKVLLKCNGSYESKWFLPELNKVFTCNGYEFISDDVKLNRLTYQYKSKKCTDTEDIITIIYYYSSPFPEILGVEKCKKIFDKNTNTFPYNPSQEKAESILEDISNWTHLYISGYVPHSSILEYSSKQKYLTIIGSNDTLYDVDIAYEDEEKEEPEYIKEKNLIDGIHYLIKNDNIKYWTYFIKNHEDETDETNKLYQIYKSLVKPVRATSENIFKIDNYKLK